MFKGAAEENAQVRFDRHPLFRETDQGEFSSTLKSRVLPSPPLPAGERSFHNKWGEERTCPLSFDLPKPGKLSEPRRIVREPGISSSSSLPPSLCLSVSRPLTYGPNGRLSQGWGQWGAR